MIGWGKAVLVAGALALAIPSAAAGQAFSNGIYVVQGGSYSIQVEQQGDNLVVVEPNKRSVYERQVDGTYHFYNPNTDAVYGIRVIDRATIEAFKPHEAGNIPTRLGRMGGAPAVEQVELAPSASEPRDDRPAGSLNPSAGDKWGQIAQGYLERTKSDPDNVQSWAACAAAALKRSTANAAEAEAYAAQSARALKPILVDPTRSPCEDVLPSALFADAPPPGVLTAEQEQRLRALNAQADARIEAEKIAAARREEERRAYERQVAEVEAARAQYDRDRAAHQAEVERAAAAKAAYERQLEEYRRQVADPN